MSTPPARKPKPYTPKDDTAGVKIWKVYVEEAEKYDTALVESWKSDMEGVLIFAGLFSAILTAFLIESYKALTPDSGDEMKAVLIQILSVQLSGITNRTSVDLPTPEPFVAPTSSLVCNLLWFISLGLSLSSALIATLVEQWARDFKYKTERRSAPVVRARLYSYLYYGLKRFNMHAVVDIIPLLLHASLILFFAGLVAFLVPVNNAVMISVVILLGIVVIAYTTLTVLPLFSRQSPYQTPLSAFLWRVVHFTRSIWQSEWERRKAPNSMANAMNAAAIEPPDSEQLMAYDCRALAWTLASLSDDEELEPFLVGIVDALTTTDSNTRSYYHALIGRLLQSSTLLLSRGVDFCRRCNSTGLPPEMQAKRQLLALKSGCVLAAVANDCDLRSHWGLQSELSSLHQQLDFMGHRHFVDFMVHAATLDSPSQSHQDHTEKLLFGSEAVTSTPEIAAMYSNAVNTVIDRCRELDSNLPYVDSILASLLRPLAQFGPSSNVSLPTNLSCYLSKPYFDHHKSLIVEYCDKWWLCSCLKMGLATRPSDVPSDTTDQILRAMWRVVAAYLDYEVRFFVPTHPSRSKLAALCRIADKQAISIIPLIYFIQNAGISESWLESDPLTNVRSLPTLTDEELKLILSASDMRVAILAKFIRQAGTLHTPPIQHGVNTLPYNVHETMSNLTRFICEDGVSQPQQLDFATSWKTALQNDSPEGSEFQATLVEVIATCPLLSGYVEDSGLLFVLLSRRRWLKDSEAAKVFVEGVRLAEGRQDIAITSTSRTQLAEIRECLMKVVGT
ncbi:hypothetical protein R3P38DRAFT_3222874 [Favolaschia claudopus]|uniref:DUF6535 domain-containing protein n=1 Tax=Favolaschia claudopus TaxID=2862362 RepID=A0AAV9ZXF9_9AGAR